MSPDKFLKLLKAREEMRVIGGVEPPPIADELIEAALLDLFGSFVNVRDRTWQTSTTVGDHAFSILDLKDELSRISARESA